MDSPPREERSHEKTVLVTVKIDDAEVSYPVRLRDTRSWPRVVQGSRFKHQRREELSYGVGKAAEAALRGCLARVFGAF